MIKNCSQTIDLFHYCHQYQRYLKKVILNNQTYKYFQNQELFFNGQYDFRTEHSSEYAALEVIH